MTSIPNQLCARHLHFLLPILIVVGTYPIKSVSLSTCPQPLGCSRIADPCSRHDATRTFAKSRSCSTEDTGCRSRENYYDCSVLSTVPTNRRTALTKGTGSVIATFLGLNAGFGPARESSALGTLPEYADTNAILQGLTIKVSDGSQQDAMIRFLQDAFDFRVLRQRKIDSVTDTWLGFGPEQLSIPADFEVPVSSFTMYGGHASVHIRYDAKDPSVSFKVGDDTSKENIAYLQVGVPTYRISQMVKNRGNVLDAYGIVNVISPSGLPMRGIVGIRPDPIMFVAINCKDVKESVAFYEQLGMVEQPYPYARPSNGTGQFEPPQPAKSVYLAHSPNSMGVLLLQAKNKREKVARNPCLSSLNVVYTPSDGGGDGSLEVADPSGVTIAFVDSNTFEREERSTRV